jgi:glycosyltransferase involved in cell wall biosynthesis
MRVLYLLANYPQYSESYIDAEINYARSQGVEVGVWSSVSGYGDMLKDVPVLYGQDPMDAIRDFRPDLLHVHYLVTAQQVFRSIFVDLPITVRAHSFDWDLGRAAAVAAVDNVRAIYAFPHFAREAAQNSKIVPLPVAFDAALYDAPLDATVVKDRVVRLAAGRRMKGLEDFFTVAWKLFPQGSFTMAVSRIRGDEDYVGKMIEAGMRTGVVVFNDLNRAKAVEMIRTAGVYLDTSDPTGHPFGMPISIAEAMASGAVVLIRDCPAAREYAGLGAQYYRSIDEAVEMVRGATDLHELHRKHISEMARERARLYRSDVVLPRLVKDWDRFVQEKKS